MGHPGLEEALSGGVGTGVNHTSLSPINKMASRVSMLVAVSAFRAAL